jgi:hypothetical protein
MHTVKYLEKETMYLKQTKVGSKVRGAADK